MFEFIELKRWQGDRMLHAVWENDAMLGYIEHCPTRIYNLSILKDKRGNGYGMALAVLLMSQGRKPVNIKKSAKGFWAKVEARITERKEA